MGYLRDLGTFLWAVINNWAGYATGGVVVALLGLWSTLRRPISRNAGIVITLVFLFAAFFNAWLDQHREALAAQKQLQELTVPQLKGLINEIGVAPAVGGGALITIVATISNAGAQSYAENFRATMKTAEGELGLTFVPPPSSTYTIFGGDKRAGIRFQESDYLVKAARTPIPLNGKVDGYLIVFAEHVSFVEANSSTTSYTLYFSDARGKQYSATFSPGVRVPLLNLNDLQKGVKKPPNLNP